MKQNQVPPPPLYVPDQCTDQSRLRGLSRKRGILSGFHQVALRLGPNGLRPQGLKEYSDSYSVSDYLGPVLGSKCLVTQTTGNYLGLGPFGGNLGEDVSGCHPDFQSFILISLFVYLLVSLL
jgi:hypothetical protein